MAAYDRLSVAVNGRMAWATSVSIWAGYCVDWRRQIPAWKDGKNGRSCALPVI